MIKFSAMTAKEEYRLNGTLSPETMERLTELEKKFDPDWIDNSCSRICEHTANIKDFTIASAIFDSLVDIIEKYELDESFLIEFKKELEKKIDFVDERESNIYDMCDGIYEELRQIGD